MAEAVSGIRRAGISLGLTGRTAVITGASVGIGRTIASVLAGQGVHLVLAARRRPLLEEVAAELTAASDSRIAVVETDVTEAGQLLALRDRALDFFGGQLDVLINNAGGSRPIPVDADDSVWTETMELNFHAPRRLTHLLLPALKESQAGRVINISGTSEPRSLNAANSAKAALHAWSKGLSREVGQFGITVNCVPPGRIFSEQIVSRLHPDPAELQVFAERNIPLRRFGDPEEVAWIVAFLASDLAQYVSGELLHVDGGMRRFAF